MPQRSIGLDIGYPFLWKLPVKNGFQSRFIDRLGTDHDHPDPAIKLHTPGAPHVLMDVFSNDLLNLGTEFGQRARLDITVVSSKSFALDQPIEKRRFNPGDIPHAAGGSLYVHSDSTKSSRSALQLLSDGGHQSPHPLSIFFPSGVVNSVQCFQPWGQ